MPPRHVVWDFSYAEVKKRFAFTFNEREGNVIDVIHGAVTTGVLWQFVRLHGKVITLDLIEYPISQPERVLGLLTRMVLPEQENTR